MKGRIREIIEKYSDDFEISDGSVTMGYDGKVIIDRDFDKLEKELVEYIKDKIEDVIVYGKVVIK